MSLEASHPAPSRTTESRALNVALWILQGVTALAFVVVAIGKFTGSPLEVATFDAIGIGDWFRYGVGTLEIAGAAGLLIPRLTGLAAACLAALMVGAVLTQLLVVGSGVAFPVPYLVVTLLIAGGRRRDIARLWAQLRGRSS